VKKAKPLKRFHASIVSDHRAKARCVNERNLFGPSGQALLVSPFRSLFEATARASG
jgi:hypothetical protein